MIPRGMMFLAWCWLALSLVPAPVSAQPYVDPPKGSGMSHATTPYVLVTFRADIAEDAIRASIHDAGGYVLRYFAQRATVVTVFPALNVAGSVRRQMILRNIERQRGVTRVAVLQDVRNVVYNAAETGAATGAGDATPQLDGGILEWALATGRKNSRAHFYATHPNT